MTIAEKIGVDRLAGFLEQYPWLTGTVAQYITVGILVLLVYAIAKVLTLLIEKYAKHLTKKTETKFDDMILKTVHRSITFILVLTAFYFGMRSLVFSEEVYNALGKGIFVLFTLKIARELEIFLDFLIQNYLRPLAQKQKGFMKIFIPPFLKFTRFLVWTLAFLLIISNLGYNVTSLVAGLGIGGVALALAAQETLSNVFGSISVMTDQPFSIGDWIILDDYEGEVKEVGLRSTKIETMDKSIVSIPNSTVASAVIENFSRKDKFKCEINLALTYDTNVKKIKRAIETIEGVLKKDKNVDNSVFRVNFTKFGESALELLVLCYVKDMDSYAGYLQVRQRINLQIKEEIEKIGVEFAFPTQSLYIKHARSPRKTATRSKTHR